MSASPRVVCVPDHATGTCQWIFWCPATRKAVVVDPVLDYDADSGRFSSTNVSKLVDCIKQEGLTVDYILETHVHADHVTGSQELRKLFPDAKLGIGEGVKKVQETFKAMFNLCHLRTDGSQFDVLFEEGDQLRIGECIHVRVLSTPGHTTDSVAFVIANCGICVGDTLFFPDKGTARCDFPGGDAATLYQSVQKILAFPDDTKIFLCHDYPGVEREFQTQTTVADEKAKNIHLHPGIDFVQMRTLRDVSLKVPHLLIPSVQLNVDAGAFPPPEENGTSYIKIPINVLK
jgi:glyoxylase-like metal-dependent hydrolase (beta-lactamase superfamily II)